MLLSKIYKWCLILCLTLCAQIGHASAEQIGYLDFDGDGFGDIEHAIVFVDSIPAGFVLNALDCDDTNSTVYPGAPEICYDGIDNNCNGELSENCVQLMTQLKPIHCEQTVSSLTFPIRASSIPLTSIPDGTQILLYRFKIRNLATSQISFVNSTTPVFSLSQAAYVMYDCAFEVSVSVHLNNEWMPFGSSCIVYSPTVPIPTVHPISCDVQVNNMNSIIRSETIPKAVRYEFEVSLVEDGIVTETVTLIRPVASFNLFLLQGISLKFSATYQVRVRVEGLTPSGFVWSSEYGPSCLVYSPHPLEIWIEGCDSEIGLLPNSLLTVLYAKPGEGISQYRFTLSDENGYIQTHTSEGRTFRLSSFNNLAPLTPGATYSLAVETMIYGFYYYGKDCNVTAPSEESIVLPREIANDKGNSSFESKFKAIAYPNPFTTSFAIHATTSNTSNITLAVYDITGRLLEAKEMNINDMANFQFGDRYPTGVYNLIIIQGEEKKTMRVIKQ